MGTYIGITGIYSLKQIRVVRNLVKLTDYDRIGFGLIHYLIDTNNGLSEKKLKVLCQSIEESSPKDYSIIHLNQWTDNLLARRKARALSQILSNQTIIQINRFSWCNESLQSLQEVFPENKVILPLNPIRTSPDKCLKLLRSPHSNIHTVLIDYSEGRGLASDAYALKEIIVKFKLSLPSLSLGIAGGLGIKIDSEMKTLLKRYGPLSTDAETGLTTNGSIDLSRVFYYFKQILEINKNH